MTLNSPEVIQAYRLLNDIAVPIARDFIVEQSTRYGINCKDVCSSPAWSPWRATTLETTRKVTIGLLFVAHLEGNSHLLHDKDAINEQLMVAIVSTLTASFFALHHSLVR